MKNKHKKYLLKIVMSISILVYLICVFVLTRWYVQNERNKKFISTLDKEVDEIVSIENTIDDYKTSGSSSNNSVKQYNNKEYPSDLKYINVDLGRYKVKNKETVGWIQVNGTNINYPLVQHKDNDYYLTHDFYNRKTNIGWVFVDYRNDFKELDNNTIIYGHNLLNKTMFGQLPNLLKNKWQKNKNNHYIKLVTKKEKSIWKIFSVYEIEPVNDYLQTIFDSENNYYLFLKMLKSRSSFDFGANISKTDRIVTLSTCNNAGDRRVVVHAKLVSSEKR
ncbi:MAG: class B sortase [Bacilli bacterium]|nr:class B sortase [Bacilli bacterium]